MNQKSLQLAKELEAELKNRILPFWAEHTPDWEYGGFIGYISADMNVEREHFKSGVICARILWTFSKAYHHYKNEEYLKIARHAYEFLTTAFWDKENGGIYWTVDYQGNCESGKKQIYAQAFAIYGLAEYYRASGEQDALKMAMELFRYLERYGYDAEYGGYIDALDKDWSTLEDTSLSDKDMNVAKTMNTNLHVIEGYTNLFSITADENVRTALKKITEDMVQYILDDSSGHFLMYFDKDWTKRSDMVSYGHDIEGSWLLEEAAAVLGDAELYARIKATALQMAEMVYQDGRDLQNGGLYGEMEHGNPVGDDKEWWTQAEAVVGFYNAYTLSGDEKYLDCAAEIWEYIKSHLLDYENGEWFWGVSLQGCAHENEEKVGPWKCPYHNGRMCFEIINRVKAEEK